MTATDAAGATALVPAIVNMIDADGKRRISVFDAERAEICGAFQPIDRPYWLMYLTKTVADTVNGSDHALVPRRVLAATQQDAEHWVELIAGLYIKAANQCG